MKTFRKILISVVIIITYGFCSIDQNQSILDKLKRVEEGKTLHDLNAWVINPNEKKINYQNFKGKWLLIDFWSTGCVPCIKEFPKLKEFSENFNKDNLHVITVSVDRKFSRYIKSAKKYKINMPHFFGGFTFDNDLFNLNIKASKTDEGKLVFRTLTPQYVLINPEGKIVNKEMPKPSSPEFKKLIKQYIND